MLLAASRALASGGGSKPHLRDLITRPGIGHRILVGGNTQAKITITYPAARPLNANPQYGEELRDLTLAGYRDWTAIISRANQLFTEAIAALNNGRASA